MAGESSPCIENTVVTSLAWPILSVSYGPACRTRTLSISHPTCPSVSDELSFFAACNSTVDLPDKELVGMQLSLG
jgi:hypothetical protein